MKKGLLILLVSLFTISVNAQSGQALVLNGTNQYMKIANHPDFDIAQNESFTVTAWVKN